MRRAVAFTLAVLDASAEVDVDRTEEDRQLLRELKGKLEPHSAKLAEAQAAIEGDNYGAAMRLHARVLVGDATLDRGIRVGNAETRRGLKNKPGLEVTHVFGSPIEVLIRAPIRTEPMKVLEAVARLDDVADFERKAQVKSDLTMRATNQERLLVEREQGGMQSSRLASEAVRAVVDASHALVRTKAGLDSAFPRQRQFVGSFFFDALTLRRTARVEPVEEEAPGETIPSATA